MISHHSHTIMRNKQGVTRTELYDIRLRASRLNSALEMHVMQMRPKVIGLKLLFTSPLPHYANAMCYPTCCFFSPPTTYAMTQEDLFPTAPASR